MKIAVVVIDASSGTHREDMLAAQQMHPQFAFEPLLNKTFGACSNLEMLSDSSIPGRPPCSVIQQTYDVLAALHQCAARAPGPADWVSLIEDDTELCRRNRRLRPPRPLLPPRRLEPRLKAHSRTPERRAFEFRTMPCPVPLTTVCC